ncbi:D-alanyl-D-alanine carboxypeptidase/D-alanyl-D-alanine-endopeptidase [Streptomyces sp. NPDC001941]|uniref:D-alanyl-D-alanine carboxypeptidase/D-alanyl-D-alanine endopeptidase n=1 Tax=Streptomyces sp. NPDC001941 TaxID=3154659 RepID=UPI00332A0AD1
MPDPRTWRYAGLSAVLGLAVAAGSVAVAGPWDTGQRKAERDRVAASRTTGGAHHDATAPEGPAPAPSAPGVLAALGAPAAAPAPLARTLDPLLADPALGTRQAASVVDVASGRTLYASGAGDLMTPASTVKIATAAAALTALGPDHRFATTATATPDGRTVTLVGGGDTTLDGARLRRLARDAARALRDLGAGPVRVAYDTSLFTGPELHPISPNENIAAVTALMVDEGRLDGSYSGPAARTGTPAKDAALAFARALATAGVPVQGDPVPARSPRGAKPLARTLSAPLSAVVERMLTHSDNDIAEALTRHTALASGRPASFTGGELAVRTRLASLGAPVAGARFADGSGLDRTDKVSATLLTTLLARAADPGHPELRPILTGLPVAGFSGTLRTRSDQASGGLVRAKTGTLSSVDTLAGTAVTPEGRLVAFAFLASGTRSADTARPALDRLTRALVTH